jgi:hypothetical protein
MDGSSQAQILTVDLGIREDVAGVWKRSALALSAHHAVTAQMW